MTTKATTEMLDYTPAELIQLKAMGFSDEKVRTPERIIASLSGKDKTGKTHIACTAPPPITFLDIDIGVEGVVNKFQDSGKQILVYKVRVPKGEVQGFYTTMWTDVKARIKKVCDMNKGTLVMDTASEIYELARLARFGKLEQVMPHHYSEVNSEWRKEIMAAIFESDINAVLLHKVKPKYINNVRTSESEVSGFGETGYLVQLNAITYCEEDEDGKTQFCLYIENSRHNHLLKGQVLRGPMFNFSTLIKLAHSK